MRKLATKIAKRLSKKSATNVISMAAYREAKSEVDAVVASIKSAEAQIHEGQDPDYALYMQAQNVLSVLLEGLLTLDELNRFSATISVAEDEYLPSGPPMSPISRSYFFAWSSFDLAFGLQKESLVSIVCDLQHLLKLSPMLVQIFSEFNRSSLGVYQHMGMADHRVILRDMLSDAEYWVTNPTGYVGVPGEIWLVRLLPSFMHDPNYKVCFGTPYLLGSDDAAWRAYLTQARWRQHNKNLDAIALLKYGLSPQFWLEFIMQAYIGVAPKNDAICLQGIPDIGASRAQFSERGSAILPEAH